jgi:hypothetical protein
MRGEKMDNWYPGKFRVGGKARRHEAVWCVKGVKGKFRGEKRVPSQGKRKRYGKS